MEYVIPGTVWNSQISLLSSLVLLVVSGILLFELVLLVIGISISNKLLTVCTFDVELLVEGKVLEGVVLSFSTSFHDKLNISFL